MKIGVNETLSTNIEDLPGEIWEDIPGTNERYQISNYSRVKSLIKGRPIIVKKSLSNGRFKVIIYPKKGKIKNHECGRLVLEVFLRAPEENEVIFRRDGNVLNDMVSNLRWTSKKDSAKAAVERGRFPVNHGRGERNGMNLLSPRDVIEIRRLKAEGKTYKQLCDTFKISKGCIQNMIQNRTWKTIN
ncbi:NUMOD4 domain-containing protein [Chryseobacterium proteolyticum]|uniref:NUMOD4 domain-containing protein n=1 Tax=Chryseobacterium proteolyticum TaxID=118127 RepID=UPI0039830DD9